MTPPKTDLALVEALDRFVASRVALEDTIGYMRDRQSDEIRAAKRRRVGYFVAAAVVFAIVAVVASIAFHSLTTAGDARSKTLSDVEGLVASFDDCITPGPAAHPHKCYADSNTKTAQILETLKVVQIKASAYAVECVIAGRVDVEACVGERFAGASRPMPATTSPTGTTTTTTVRRSAATTPATAGRSPSPSPGTTVPALTTVPTVQPCQLNLKVFCITKPASPCTTLAVACLPNITK